MVVTPFSTVMLVVAAYVDEGVGDDIDDGVDGDDEIGDCVMLLMV